MPKLVRTENNIIATNKGMSLVEVTISLGIFSIIAAATASMLVFISAQAKKTELKTSKGVESSLVTRFFLKDFSHAGISLNNINLTDDQGKNFYDLDNSSSETRTFTISTSKDFIFATLDESSQETLFDPFNALVYNATTGAYTISLNRNNILSDGTNLLSDGKILIFDSPARFQDTTVKTKPQRSPAFFGVVQADKSVTGNDLSNLPLIKSHPQYSGASMDTIGDFMNTLPIVGGARPIVRIRSIKFTKYSIKTVTIQGKAVTSLYKTPFANNVFSTTNEVEIGKNIQSVIVKRNVKDPVFNFEINQIE